MKGVQAKDLRGNEPEELKRTLSKLQNDLFQHRLKRSTNQLENTMLIRNTRRDIAKIHFGRLGTRIFYTQLGGFDTHAMQALVHPVLLRETAEAMAAFYADLREHNAADNVAILVFSEFGRRVHDNGGGTDHGAGGTAFVIGGRVRGGFYGEVPSLRPTDQEEGDLKFNVDFRKVYATILEQWLQVDSKQVLGRAWEQLDLFHAPAAAARQRELVDVA